MKRLIKNLTYWHQEPRVRFGFETLVLYQKKVKASKDGTI
uniref:Uncharacterized protein n=1 Tax=Manihot esculenta TaxID=3983 RepID=A0A2C9WCB3_MANES